MKTTPKAQVGNVAAALDWFAATWKRAARTRVKALRKTARVGDAIAPTGERWRAERGHS